MKRLVLVAALGVALAGCDNAAEESDDPLAEGTVAATPEAATESSAGTYEVAMSDGTVLTATLSPDGTYEDVDAEGGVVENGTWEDRPDGKVCFDSEQGDDTVLCFTIGEPAEDGSMVATPDDGTDPITIRKTAEPAA